MKANELRIGNLVLDRFGKILEVESINYKGVNLVGGDGYCVYPNYEFSELQPIQLTEEWLLKFGFEKDNYGTYYLSKIDGFNDLWLKSEVDKFGVALNLFHNINRPTYFKSTQYIHQLQNLYFALTGGEITIKE